MSNSSTTSSTKPQKRGVSKDCFPRPRGVACSFPGGKHTGAASASKGGDHLEQKGVKAGTAEGQQPEESPGGLWRKRRREGEEWLLFCLPVNLRSCGSFFSACL